MKLGIDIGNTRITLATFKAARVKVLGGVLTRQASAVMSLELSRLFKKILKSHPQIREAVIGSVVPSATRIVERQARLAGLKVVVVGRDTDVPIKNNYKFPKQVGIDRLLCAYAAKVLYGAPLIVIDFGTAITFEVVSKSGDYEGGLIIPGIQLSLDSLSQKTALLPRVENVRKPKHLIGQTTQESILSGVLHGYGAMCDGLIDQFLKSRPKQKFKIILTGGYAPLIRALMSRRVDCVNEDLVFQGMALL